MSVRSPASIPHGLRSSALLIVDMNRSHLDHSIGHLLVAKPDADRIIARCSYACARPGLRPADR